MRAPRRAQLTLALAAAMLAGCTTGPMDIREVRYWAVSNGKETNYYRLRVTGATRLGVAGYKSGWFPARAVDRLFGDVSSDGGVTELQVRTELEQQIAEKIKATQSRWLQAAENPDADPATLRALMEARRRILAYPAKTATPFPDAIEVEYNPGLGVATRYADEKLVFVLASNPDEIISSLARFVEEDKTVLTVNRLAGIITQRAAVDVASREAVQSVDKGSDARLVEGMQKTRTRLAPGTDKATALGAVDVLLTLVDSLYP